MSMAEKKNRVGRRAPPYTRGLLVKVTKTLLTIAVTMVGLMGVTFTIGRVMRIGPVLPIVGA
ncbi:MAG: ABC transporter permease, partial [Rhodobacteraceae bacterium]|nr:ABC transporter permease [Paracoccaceae bacterium]